MSTSIHQYTQQYPYHLSVGAVVLNDKNEVALHHFDQSVEFDDVYYMMRCTVKPRETIEDALQRGLIEEMGITATPRHFVGNHTSGFFATGGEPIQKTTIFYLCDLEIFDIEKRNKDHHEASSTVLFMDMDEAIGILKEQFARTRTKDICEFRILEQVQAIIT